MKDINISHEHIENVTYLAAKRLNEEDLGVVRLLCTKYKSYNGNMALK